VLDRMSASRAAACPLRTAPSIVAGQPVSVQAPASDSPGTSVCAGGLSPPAPGAARNVARGERVTVESSSVALRARGSICTSASVDRATICALGSFISATAADSEIASSWPVSTPAASVRSKIHWSGEETTAATGVWSTRRS
jgi:hypothetical protein